MESAIFENFAREITNEMYVFMYIYIYIYIYMYIYVCVCMYERNVGRVAQSV